MATGWAAAVRKVSSKACVGAGAHRVWSNKVDQLRERDCKIRDLAERTQCRMMVSATNASQLALSAAARCMECCKHPFFALQEPNKRGTTKKEDEAG